MANFQDKTFESKVMKDGRKLTIREYRNYKDIDVEYEDGTILRHQHYEAFKKGILGCNTKKSSRLGETRQMNNGQKATIVAYRNTMNIDVRFEDGTIVQHKSYASFQKGGIANPMFYLSQRQGEKRKMNNGMWAIVETYRECKDIDIRFEDGTLVQHRHYNSFLKGEIKYPFDSKSRIGLTKRMSNGQMATILHWRNSKDIDLKFEDGTIVRHKTYSNFQKGSIGCYNFKYHNVVVKQVIPDTEYYLCQKEGKLVILTYAEMDKAVSNE